MNDKSFESLLYGITSNAVQKIMEHNELTEDAAIEQFTQSKLYSYLEKEETKVWHYSSYMLAQLFNDEKRGELNFPEV